MLHRHTTVFATLLLTSLLGSVTPASAGEEQEHALYLDPEQPVEVRVEDLLARLTLEEKVSLCHANSLFTTAGVPRLGIPTRWLSDGPHGVREEVGPDSFRPAGRTDDFATYLPVSIALAATWDLELARAYGEVLGEEARARGKDFLLGPGINIARTPLNGRTFEYYSEDPFLISQLVVPSIQGLQSKQTAACLKHFALNNQEYQRGFVNVEADERALREIYLPGFKAAVQDAGVLSVMGAYNKLRGQHCCHNDLLLNQILKGEWGFSGLVMSDWGGTHDTDEAVHNGLDLEMGTRAPYDQYYLATPFFEGIKDGTYDVALLDDKVRRHLRVMFAVDTFGERGSGSLNTPEHQQTARKIGEQAMVLLKNEGALLPLDTTTLTSIAVIGDNATRRQAHAGGSTELKALYEVTPLEGIITAVGKSVDVTFSQGYRNFEDTTLLDRATAAAAAADVAICVVGLTHEFAQDAEGVDRPNMRLPFGQDELISKVVEANPKTVVVLVSGSPLAMDPWLDEVPSVLQAWYAGMEGGHALARVLFGEVNPSGKLPLTFPKKLEDSPAHALDAYPGKDATVQYKEGILVGYRWFDTKDIEPLFPFGHGLSYTTFAYDKLEVAPGDNDGQGPTATVKLELANTGELAGAEVVQVYVADVAASLPRPAKELKGFAKVALEPGQRTTVEIPLPITAFAFYEPGRRGWLAEPGEFEILVGSSSRDIRLQGTFALEHEWFEATPE